MAPRMSEEALSKHDEGSDAEEILRTFDVVGALSEISPVQREVLVLAYFRGLSQREISRRTGTPLGTVKSRTTAALCAIRKRMLARKASDSSRRDTSNDRWSEGE